MAVVVPVERTFTLSGYLRGDNGETLINATVYDLTTGVGTTTNEYGFFSLTLPAGKHRLRYSYVGYREHTAEMVLSRNEQVDLRLTPIASLPEILVVGDRNSPLLNTQTGKRSLSVSDIKTEFSLFSSPDVVKTLQRTSGVAEGVELASGLYVHGGGNDENLFLIDGTPLYQVNHLAGLFSSFNTDVVKNVDFYKSGFPARYGGRLSSVVDVRTNDGNMERHHGLVRIGLLDGALQFEGPIRKGTTSYNIGLRRSWLDLLSRPALALANKNNKEEKITMNYFFHDLNAKITHRFSPKSTLFLSVYSGTDGMKVGDTYYDYANRGDYSQYDKYSNTFDWGNFNTALNWNYLFSPKLFANFTAVYSHNRFNYNTLEDSRYAASSSGNGVRWEVNHNEHRFRSTIDDMGYRADFDFRPAPRHHLRFGHHFTHHLFKPQTMLKYSYNGDAYEGSSAESNAVDTLYKSSRNRHVANEVVLYAEDEMQLSSRWNLNVGFNANLFAVEGKSYMAVDPRLSVKYQVHPRLSAKASCTVMTQYVHKISNSFLDLPTDYWVPTTHRVRPMRSVQLAAGLYANPSRQWLLSLEGYYKTSSHLLQYTNWMGIEPPADRWDTQVSDGKGRTYGVELDAQYHTGNLTLGGSYTLSWSERYFADFYPEWYFDKFDNRHKLQLDLRYRFGKRTSVYASWLYHTGNRATIPTQYAEQPGLPSFNGTSEGLLAPDEGFFYTRPNNVSVPAYHRLDVGFNFTRPTRKGHEHVWNLSVYNAYCHFNTMWVQLRYDADGRRFTAKAKGFIPVLPSFSYTFKF